MSDERPVNRRGFFRQGLSELMRQVGQAMRPLQDVARQFGELEREAAYDLERAVNASDQGAYTPPEPLPPPPLRPPGALSEYEFREMCSRSGNCVSACPVHAIKLDPAEAQGDGAPWIDADEQPCVVCAGLFCMQSCPSGAILPTQREQINMGLALWDEQLCLRTKVEPAPSPPARLESPVGAEPQATPAPRAPQTINRDCTTCIDKCPMGAAAIRLESNRVVVLSPGCIGCGVCQHECPTRPRAIVVRPREY
jgi:ferredoxin-type protein NapG